MDFKMINVVGASAVALQEQVKLLNSEFGLDLKLTGEETYRDLQALVKDGQEKAKAKMPQQNSGGNGSAPSSEEKSSNAVYVWLKSPAYVDKDGAKRVAGGFYHLDLAQYPRLRNLPRQTCETFEDVPTRKLADIAKWFGMNPEKYKTDEALLAALVKEPTLF